MSRTITLANLRTRTRELADQEGDTAQFIDDTELNAYINASYGLWHTMVAQADPERFLKEETITAPQTALAGPGGDLPADYLSTYTVEYQKSSDWYVPLERISRADRTKYAETTSSHAVAYFFHRNNLVLWPAPSSGTYRHTYVTHADVLSSDSETVDGINGWEAWIYYDAAIKCMMKEESDASFLISERNRIEREIAKAAADRDYANPGKIRDTRLDRLYKDGWDNWWWYTG